MSNAPSASIDKTDDILASERREYLRIEAPVLVESAGLFTARRRVVDIGPKGFRVYSDTEPKVGQRFEIELTPENQRGMRFVCRVAWVKPLKAGPAPFDIGIEILDGKPKDLRDLEGFLANLPQTLGRADD